MFRRHLLTTAATGLAALAVTGVAHANVRPVAFLSSSSAIGDPEFEAVAAAGSTVVAAGAVTDVYARPAGGWRTAGPSADLTDPRIAGGLGDSVSISARTVLESLSTAGGGDAEVSAGEVEDVFVAPMGRWTGSVTPAARLITGRRGESVNGAVLNGRTAVAYTQVSTADLREDPADGVAIFREPAGGWSGQVTPAAHLRVPAGSPGVGLAISGATAYVSTGRRTYVYREPTGGWRGVVSPEAILNGSGHVSVSDQTVIVGGLVFRVPRRGTAGPIRPEARIDPATRDGRNADLTSQSFSDGLAATSSVDPDAAGCAKLEDPCPASVRVVAEPASGWAGDVSGRRVISTTTGDLLPLAQTRRDLFAANFSTVEVYPLSVVRHAGGFPKRRSGATSQSRRGDSNSRPLHYE